MLSSPASANEPVLVVPAHLPPRPTHYLHAAKAALIGALRARDEHTPLGRALMRAHALQWREYDALVRQHISA